MSPRGASSALTCLAFLALIFSGCAAAPKALEAPGDPTDPCAGDAGTSRACAAPPARLEYKGCRSWDIHTEARQDEVQALLPPSYRVRSSLDAGGASLPTASVNLQVLQCKEVALNGISLEGPFAAALVFAAVDVEDRLAGMHFNGYAVEVYLGDKTPQEVAALFASAGYSPLSSQIELSTPTAGLQIKVDGTPRYEVSIAGIPLGSGPVGVERADERVHRISDTTGLPTWYDDLPGQGSQPEEGAAILQAHGGALSKLGTGASGALAAVAFSQTGDGTLLFGRA